MQTGQRGFVPSTGAIDPSTAAACATGTTASGRATATPHMATAAGPADGTAPTDATDNKLIQAHIPKPATTTPAAPTPPDRAPPHSTVSGFPDWLPRRRHYVDGFATLDASDRQRRIAGMRKRWDCADSHRELTTVLTTTMTTVAFPATPPTRPFAADLAWSRGLPAPGSVAVTCSSPLRSRPSRGRGPRRERRQQSLGHLQGRLFTPLCAARASATRSRCARRCAGIRTASFRACGPIPRRRRRLSCAATGQ
jgi:hypothetical protein